MATSTPSRIELAGCSSRIINQCYNSLLHRKDVAPWSPPRGQAQPKQAAQQYVNEQHYGHAFGGAMPIISRELSSGRRVYRCQPWASFFPAYATMSEKDRVFYELSRTADPCKLYFDIEDENLPADDEDAFQSAYLRVGAFVGWVTQKLALVFPELEADAKRMGKPFVDVQWSDASSMSKPKFSLHLVFNLVGNAMFADRLQLMRFMNWLSQEVALDEFPTCTHMPSADAYLAATAAESEDSGVAPTAVLDHSVVFLPDMSVYSEGDREFRLLFSHKYHATERVLRPYDPLHHTIRRQPLGKLPDSDDETLFYRSLVSHQPANANVYRLLQCSYTGLALRTQLAASSSNLSGTGLALAISGGHSNGSLSSAAMADTLYVNGIRLRRKRERPDEAPARTVTQFFGGSSSSSNSGAAGPLTDTGERSALSVPEEEKQQQGYLTPDQRLARLERLLPRLQSDITRQLPEPNVNLSLVGYFPQRGCLVFASDNQECEIKRDRHYSNHVYYVAWLDSCVFYQRCPSDVCLARYIQDRTWGDEGPPPNLRHARGATRMFGLHLWAEARTIAFGREEKTGDLPTTVAESNVPSSSPSASETGEPSRKRRRLELNEVISGKALGQSDLPATTGSGDALLSLDAILSAMEQGIGLGFEDF